MPDLDEANAILEAQRGFATVIALCRDTDHYLSLLAPEELERALEPDPLPPSTLALLARDRDR